MDNFEDASADIISFKFTKKLINLREGEDGSVSDMLNKRIYLLQPMYVALPFNINKKLIAQKKICEEFEKDHIYKHLDEFFNYLNTLLKETYKQ